MSLYDFKISLSSDHNLFYDNQPVRPVRMGCMWDPPSGKRRLLYDCVWLVSASQWTLQILLRVSFAPLAVSLHCRPSLENCTSHEDARFASRGLVDCKSRKHKSGGGLRAQASLAASTMYHTFGKPNYLAAASLAAAWG